MQLLLQLCFGWQFGPVFGNGDAVFVHLQQLHLFAAGFGAQDEADGGLFARLVAIGMTGGRINVFGWTLTVPSVLWSTCWPWVSFYPHASETQWAVWAAPVAQSAHAPRPAVGAIAAGCFG